LKQKNGGSKQQPMESSHDAPLQPIRARLRRGFPLFMYSVVVVVLPFTNQRCVFLTRAISVQKYVFLGKNSGPRCFIMTENTFAYLEKAR